MKLGAPESASAARPILTNAHLFGVNLQEVGLADKVEGMFRELIAGPGAVRATLKKYLGEVRMVRELPPIGNILRA